ncbi:restriction endonuclease subunit S [Enterococcus faecium]|uniref:restriction endonuclease subunit S n=1 Tax=Enterococcus TaxID=1350 RepID=UPI0002DAC67B|nr:MULTISPECIES: restriction endonuclease subunit S [Enterococcus]MBR3047157.1 restriction endonuclease subunit S [Enterococcus sp.]MDQ8400495.1 restriction endonuclease subunit S [Enterococcus faecium]MDT6384711.1 restriction endonuclease subunit S [Enterococcus faecium]HAQ0244273.1 restriction endonuclease subunit S [Enterococcus faecium]HAQ0424330.1 restriction endonuclease subunit S [Enterococcus faecium]
MQEERTNVPKIRFKGYAEEWEERKLRDITERVRGNDGRMDLPTLTISASSGWLDQRDRFSGNIAGKEQKNYTLLKKGQLSYNHGNSKLAKYGAVFELTTYDEALVPRVYHSFDTNELASSNFIEYMFATKRPDRELAKLVSSGARMDGLLNINFDEFMGINVSVPSVGEQQKIGTFFKQLDDTIALHQRKLDLLKETKKGFLQKMFPKNGAKVPEIRFPGFTEDWEERKVFEISKVTYGGGTPKTNTKEFWNGNIPWIQSSDLEINRLFNISPKKKITSEAVKKSAAKIIPPNSIAIVTRVGVGKLALMPFEYATSQDFLSLSELQIDSYFGIFSLYSMLQKELKNIQGTSIKGMTKSDLLEKKVTIPKKYEEQQKIGNFFKQLDDTIALHQHELDSLKEMKKSLLQQMFV